MPALSPQPPSGPPLAPHALEARVRFDFIISTGVRKTLLRFRAVSHEVKCSVWGEKAVSMCAGPHVRKSDFFIDAFCWVTSPLLHRLLPSHIFFFVLSQHSKAIFSFLYFIPLAELQATKLVPIFKKLTRRAMKILLMSIAIKS